MIKIFFDSNNDRCDNLAGEIFEFFGLTIIKEVCLVNSEFELKIAKNSQNEQ